MRFILLLTVLLKPAGSVDPDHGGLTYSVLASSMEPLKASLVQLEVDKKSEVNKQYMMPGLLPPFGPIVNASMEMDPWGDYYNTSSAREPLLDDYPPEQRSDQHSIISDSDQQPPSLTYLESSSDYGDVIGCLECDPDVFEAFLTNTKPREALREAQPGHTKHPGMKSFVQMPREGIHGGGSTILSGLFFLRARDPPTEIKLSEENSAEKTLSSVKFLGTKYASGPYNFTYEQPREAYDVPSLEIYSEPSSQLFASRKLSLQEFADVKHQLLQMWNDRRLILGEGASLDHDETPKNATEGMTHEMKSIAERAPYAKLTHCGNKCGIYQGKFFESEASLKEAFRKHLFDLDKSGLQKSNRRETEEDLKSKVEEILKRVTDKYKFYRGECLPIPCGEFAGNLGLRRCESKEKADDHSCVHAEVGACGCNDRYLWFDYTRNHGVEEALEEADRRSHILGQCEEYSRVGFALLSLLGYRTRYVVDITDHVFLEVCRDPTSTSTSCSDWMHVDPSEGVANTPLMYEKDWGKKLILNLAVEDGKIYDVTKNYVLDYHKTRDRQRNYGDIGTSILRANR